MPVFVIVCAHLSVCVYFGMTARDSIKPSLLFFYKSTPKSAGFQCQNHALLRTELGFIKSLHL